MSEREEATDFQEAVDRSYRAQWGGRRFYLSTAVVLFILTIVAAVAFLAAPRWFEEAGGTNLTVIQVSALATSFVCLIAGVMAALEALERWQREKGQLPEKSIHVALTFSVITVASLAFIFFLFNVDLQPKDSMGGLMHIIRFIAILFTGLAWLSSVVMDSAGITMLLTRRSELLEVSNTTEGTELLFRKGHSTEILKLSIAVMIPLIMFIAALLMAGASLT